MTTDLHRKAVGKQPVFTFSTLLIIVTLLVSGLAIALRAYFREPISDDLLYRYVLDENPLGDNNYSVLVSGWGDAIRSQFVQYFYSNGRTLIHILVQMFTGPWGPGAYSIFLGIILVVVECLFIRYTIPAGKRKYPLTWVVAAITFLYMFQGNSSNWYSIAGGMNYMFPMCTTLCFLILMRHYCKANTPNVLVMGLLAVFGIIVGWTQECFTIPLSGGLFFLLLRDLRKAKPAVWVLAISLWVGTAILVFAPGNFIRLEGKSIINTFINGVKLLIGTYLFWIMIVSVIILRISNKLKFQEFVRHNTLPILILCVAVAFGMIANTLPQSFNGISFYSSILLFRLSYFCLKDINKTSVLNNCISAGLIVILLIHQFRIILTSREVMKYHHQFVSEYLASPDGILPVPEKIHIPIDVKPFVSTWFESDVRWWQMFTLEAYYTNSAKPLVLLDKRDYEHYMKNHSETIQGEAYLWFKTGTDIHINDTIALSLKHLEPTTFNKTYIKIMRKNPVYLTDEKEVVVDSTSLIGASGSMGVKVGDRRVEKVVIKRNTKI